MRGRDTLRGLGQTFAIIAGFVILGLGAAVWLGEPGGLPPGSRPYPAHMERLDEGVDLWLVDGFNLLHAAVLRGGERLDGWWREAARARLLDRLEARASASQPICVVFDGPGPSPEPPPGARLRVVFAPSADDWLLRQIRAAGRPSRLALVTADRRLADRARHRGARVIAPRRFLAVDGA